MTGKPATLHRLLEGLFGQVHAERDATTPYRQMAASALENGATSTLVLARAPSTSAAAQAGHPQ